MDKGYFETFISDMIKYASSGESPDYIINKLMQYIGEKLDADRAYIFEDNHDGTFDNTYEWCRAGVNPEIDNLKNVPYEGVLDIWYDEFNTRHNITIYDMEEYKDVSPVCYSYLQPQGINSLVAGPIDIGGKYEAFYGVDNPPADQIEKIASLIESMECVLSMILRMKNYTKTIQNVAITDRLTGCKNRTALNWAYDDEFDHDDSIGVMMCDLNGLKKKNDTEGHKAGDRYICNLADALIANFGRQCIYRIGGDEFVVVRLGVSLAEIENEINGFKADCKIKDVSFSLGFEYREKADEPFETMLHYADTKMYEEKKRYYESIGVDRRGK